MIQPKTSYSPTSTFDIDAAISLVREAVSPYPKAAMFALAELGYDSLFEQLISCILSIRTYDEVSLVVSQRLFEQARTPEEMTKLDEAEIRTLIDGTTYPEQKATNIKAIAHRILNEFDGEMPQNDQLLQSFKGVGPKCAHLSLGVACNAPYISVDTHVHRVTNRWGYVKTKAPVRTEAALKEQLPQEYWIEINALLVPFGKHICKGSRPLCKRCPLLPLCPRIGVGGR